MSININNNILHLLKTFHVLCKPFKRKQQRRKIEKCPEGKNITKCFQIAKALYLATLFKYDKLRHLFQSTVPTTNI